MPRRKIREYTAKNLIRNNITRFNPKFDYRSYPLHLVTYDSNFRKLKHDFPELTHVPLVAKPDMLFGKRGKHNLVVLNRTMDEVLSEIKSKLNTEIKIGSRSGLLTHFLVEKFIPHEEEYYFSISSERKGLHS